MNLEKMDIIYEAITAGEQINFSHLHSLMLKRHKMLGANILDGKNSLLKLELQNNNLSGTIPNELFSLSALEHINLQGNQLSGPFPRNAQTPMLKYMSIANNNLGGIFDFDTFGCDMIEFLDLSHNSFSGTLPSSSPFTYVWHLNITENMFSGNINEWLGKSVKEFDVSNNR